MMSMKASKRPNPNTFAYLTKEMQSIFDTLGNETNAANAAYKAIGKQKGPIMEAASELARRMNSLLGDVKKHRRHEQVMGRRLLRAKRDGFFASGDPILQFDHISRAFELLRAHNFYRELASEIQEEKATAADLEKTAEEAQAEYVRTGTLWRQRRDEHEYLKLRWEAATSWLIGR